MNGAGSGGTEQPSQAKLNQTGNNDLPLGDKSQNKPQQNEYEYQAEFGLGMTGNENTLGVTSTIN
jgi:hypothetical protein